MRVRDRRRVHQRTVDRVELEQIRVLLLLITLENVGLPRAGDRQQLPGVAPFGVQGRLQPAVYRDGRHVVERSQHDDVAVGEANGQHVIPIICARITRARARRYTYINGKCINCVSREKEFPFFIFFSLFLFFFFKFSSALFLNRD